MQADDRLIEVLLNKKVDNKTIAMLADEYAEARRLGNRRKFASVLDQLRFLEAMATKFGRTAIALGLDQLSKRLQLEKQEGIG